MENRDYEEIASLKKPKRDPHLPFGCFDSETDFLWFRPLLAKAMGEMPRKRYSRWFMQLLIGGGKLLTLHEYEEQDVGCVEGVDWLSVCFLRMHDICHSSQDFRGGKSWVMMYGPQQHSDQETVLHMNQANTFR